jgi:hypothetical protein
LDDRGIGCNGVLGAGEWDLGRAAHISGGAGLVVVAAKWNGQLLQLGVALPSVVEMVGRSEAIVVTAPPSGQTVVEKGLAVSTAFEPRQRISTFRVGRVVGKCWRFEGDKNSLLADAEGIRAAASVSGDGGLGFVVAEYVIPLNRLVEEPKEGMEFPLGVFVVNLPSRHEWRDAVRWPWGCGDWEDFNESLLCEHPDGWGRVRVGQRSRSREELWLPELTQAPVLDGEIEVGAWKDAAVTATPLVGTGGAELRIGTHGARLFLAMTCRTPRASGAPTSLELYFDPAGDGGLLPRQDDRLIVVSAQEGRSVMMRWQPPLSAEDRKVITREGKWLDPTPSRSEGVMRTTGEGMVAEVAVSLEELGLMPDAMPESIGLMVRLIYEGELTIGAGKE